MCTVSFWPVTDGYRLAMNRDEQRSRPAGVPPAVFTSGPRTTLHPAEPGGGTWVSVNDVGLALALLNWYTAPGPPAGPVVSRGRLILALRFAADLDSLSRLIEVETNGATPSLRAFRLVAVDPGACVVREWTWSGWMLAVLTHPWMPRQWSSSGHEEATAQRVRGEVFRAAALASDAGSVGWLRRLHTSHEPERGPFSTCAHRSDAKTLSYTEIEVSRSRVVLRHLNATPCGGGILDEFQVERDAGVPSPANGSVVRR